MGSISVALTQVLSAIIDLYCFLLILRALLSWFSPNPHSGLAQFLYRTTEPVLEPARRIIPPISGIDLSVVIVIAALQFLSRALLSSIGMF